MSYLDQISIFYVVAANANVDLSEVGDPDSDAAQSGIVSASDSIQLHQPARDCFHPLLVSRVPGPLCFPTRITTLLG